MKEIATLTNEDIGEPKVAGVKYAKRDAARAVLIDADGKIAILHVTKHNYYKIPGGGVDEGENVTQGLEREVMEEAGCQCEVIGEVGKIIEYRDQFEQINTSYCYLAKVVGEKHEPEYTDGERELGFELLWLPIDEAIERFESVHETTYGGKFMNLRDMTFVKEAEKMLDRK